MSPQGGRAETVADQAAASARVPAGGDSISRHVQAPVSINIFENGAGQVDVGPTGNRTVYDVHRDGGKWYADHLQGPEVGNGGLGATTLPDLARKLADRHGVSGTVSIEDERDKGKSLTQRFEHTAKAAPAGSADRLATLEREQRQHPVGSPEWQRIVDERRRLMAGGQQPRTLTEAEARREDNLAAAIRGEQVKGVGPVTRAKLYDQRMALVGAEQAATERAPRSEAFNPRVASGGNLPPRREGELSAMHDIRIAPSDDAAERLLNGYSVSGLRALARDAGFSPPSGASKAQLVDLLMGPRRRYWDSIALEGRGSGKA